MDGVLQQQRLNEAIADDFTVIKLLGIGKHGLVVKATFKREGVLSQKKFYAVKLLFNFTHEYSSVISNKFENEWLIMSRLLPHPNIVRYWSQFISSISHSFIPHIPNEIRQLVTKNNNNNGGSKYRSGQFLVFDCHSSTLSQWLAINRSSSICSPILLLKFCYEILQAINFLHQNNICHLDLKLDNVLVSDTLSIVVCDFGCAIQFSDSKFDLQWIHGLSIGGNRAHLSPEVLTEYHRCRTDHRHKTIHYKNQPAFAVGVLIYEIVTGEHPLDDYPLSYTLNGNVSYQSAVIEDSLKILSSYPPQFCQVVKELLCCDETKRIDLSGALNSIEEMLKDLNHPAALDSKQINLEEEMRCLQIEKKLAEDRIKVIASERDQALKEMKTMAEQCQEIAKEFETLATECDSTKRQLKELLREKKTVEKASEGAFEAYKILKEHLELVTRERDMAKSQVNELKLFCSKVRQEGDSIRECLRCKMFFLQCDSDDSLCSWHKGKYLFNRWSCCYKIEENAEGCMKTEHLVL